MRVDDLHGAADDATHPGDQSIFTTAVASGIKRGTAIVMAVRTDTPTDGHVASVAIRDHWGSAAAKRAALIGSGMDETFRPVPVSTKSWWRLTASVTGDDAPVDDYLPFYRSGVQPVRDDAVLAVDEAELRARMQDYFNPQLSLNEVVERHPGFGVKRVGYDPAKTRRQLLDASLYRPERVVQVLYRPFDVRWMYWEPKAQLLNRPRPELIPFWVNVPQQRCVVIPQTPRRVDALRPVVSRAVGYNEAAEPNARLFPLYQPPSVLMGEAAGELALEAEPDLVGGSGGETLVAAPWCAAARNALRLPDDTAAGEAVFYALVAVMHSPTWLARQPTELDDFPEVPVPGGPAELAAASALGRRIADLTDPTLAVPGVTTGNIRPDLAGLAIPDSATGTVPLRFGTYGKRGGQRSGQNVLWGEEQGWRNVPDGTWAYSACGFPVLPKWLSYRVTTGLRTADRQEFMLLARRVTALIALQSECDGTYQAAMQNPLEQ